MRHIVYFKEGQYAGDRRAWPERPPMHIAVAVMPKLRASFYHEQDPTEFIMPETDYYEVQGYEQVGDEIHWTYRWVRPDTAAMRKRIRELEGKLSQVREIVE